MTLMKTSTVLIHQKFSTFRSMDMYEIKLTGNRRGGPKLVLGIDISSAELRILTLFFV